MSTIIPRPRVNKPSPPAGSAGSPTYNLSSAASHNSMESGTVVANSSTGPKDVYTGEKQNQQRKTPQPTKKRTVRKDPTPDAQSAPRGTTQAPSDDYQQLPEPQVNPMVPMAQAHVTYVQNPLFNPNLPMMVVPNPNFNGEGPQMIHMPIMPPPPGMQLPFMFPNLPNVPNGQLPFPQMMGIPNGPQPMGMVNPPPMQNFVIQNSHRPPTPPTNNSNQPNLDANQLALLQQIAQQAQQLQPLSTPFAPSQNIALTPNMSLPLESIFNDWTEPQEVLNPTTVLERLVEPSRLEPSRLVEPSTPAMPAPEMGSTPMSLNHIPEQEPEMHLFAHQSHQSPLRPDAPRSTRRRKDGDAEAETLFHRFTHEEPQITPRSASPVREAPQESGDKNKQVLGILFLDENNVARIDHKSQDREPSEAPSPPLPQIKKPKAFSRSQKAYSPAPSIAPSSPPSRESSPELLIRAPRRMTLPSHPRDLITAKKPMHPRDLPRGRLSDPVVRRPTDLESLPSKMGGRSNSRLSRYDSRPLHQSPLQRRSDSHRPSEPRLDSRGLRKRRYEDTEASEAQEEAGSPELEEEEQGRFQEPYHRTFQCSNCRKMFNDPDLLQQHVLSHLQKSSIPCHYRGLCQRQFCSQEDMLEHVQHDHHGFHSVRSASVDRLNDNFMEMGRRDAPLQVHIVPPEGVTLSHTKSNVSPSKSTLSLSKSRNVGTQTMVNVGTQTPPSPYLREERLSSRMQYAAQLFPERENRSSSMIQAGDVGYGQSLMQQLSQPMIQMVQPQHPIQVVQPSQPLIQMVQPPSNPHQQILDVPSQNLSQNQPQTSSGVSVVTVPSHHLKEDQGTFPGGTSLALWDDKTGKYYLLGHFATNQQAVEMAYRHLLNHTNLPTTLSQTGDAIQDRTNGVLALQRTLVAKIREQQRNAF